MRDESTIPPSVTRPRGARGVRVAALAAAALVLGYAAAVAIVSRPSFEAVLRDRIERRLRARLGSVVVGPDVHVDAVFRATFGPVVLPGARPGDAPVLRVARVRVRPALLPLLAGRAEPASVLLDDVVVDAGASGRGVKELIDRLARRPSRRAATATPSRTAAEEPADDREREDPEIVVRRLLVRAPLAGREVELGPIRLSVRRERADGRERTEADLELPGGGRGTLSLRREGGGGWSGDLRVTGVGPATLPDALEALPVVLSRGTLALEAHGEADADLGRGRARARLDVSDAVLAGDRIGADPVGPLSASAEGTLAWDGAARRVSVPDGRLTLPGGLAIAVDAEARVGPGVPFSVRARADGVDFSAVVAALPVALGLPEDAPRPAGTLDARLDASGALLAPASWLVDASLDLSRLRDAARHAPPVPLRAPFVHRPEVERGAGPAIVVGPRSPDFVPIAELPVHVVRAVTASEDGGFFAHEGFDFQELRNAFAAGAEKGRVVRGASTITQQVAKNLYLSREKTLARKVREAALTVALEATVPKARLLEIYLNVAEWGPGIWGVGPAARHWFGKDARALTPKEAAFLATVIPNPVRYHVMWDRGAVGESWEQRVDELLLKMLDQGAITSDELTAALGEPLVFARPAAAVAGP
jgi:penicillin-binding protein 1A